MEDKPSANCKIHGYTEDVFLNKNYYYYCKECRDEYNKKYYEENTQKLMQKIKEYRMKNIESIKRRKKEYRMKNKDAIKLYQKKYRINNREIISYSHKKWNEKQVSEISDKYINNLLMKNSEILKKSDFSPMFIETYRELIKLKRFLKEKNNVNSNHR
jgi:hypothetical protein